MDNETNIILIGMPGVGKSTIGVLLAKNLKRYFLDTDIYIQTIEEAHLQEIIDARGLDEFCRIEEEHLVCIDCKNAVIATGGSAVYSEAAMEHLKSDGVAVHLDLPLEQIVERVTNLTTRGIVMEPGETLESLYEKRQPLYQKYADVTIDCFGLDHQQTIDAVFSALSL